MAPTNPTSIGRYEIIEEIGRGAMGVVYKGRDPNLDRIVAIKTISLLDLEPADEKEYRERFEQEARTAGRLSHPGVVGIFDVGSDPNTGLPYIVMEYVAGKSLNQLMEEDGKCPLGLALQLVQEIAEALDYAHQEGITHRDVKPANILVSADGRAKLADFGIARLDQTHLTLPGRLLGSPAYMAPEQMKGEEVDGRSDLFSLGVVLYRLVTGHRPFQGNTTATVCYKLLKQDPVSASALNPEVPPELDDFLHHSMAKEPADRFQTGLDMALAIQSLRAYIDIAPDPLGPMRRMIDRTGVSRTPPVLAAPPTVFETRLPPLEKTPVVAVVPVPPRTLMRIPNPWKKWVPLIAVGILGLVGIVTVSHRLGKSAGQRVAQQSPAVEQKAAVAEPMPTPDYKTETAAPSPRKSARAAAKPRANILAAQQADEDDVEVQHRDLSSSARPPILRTSANPHPPTIEQPIVVHNLDFAKLDVVIEHGFEAGTASVEIDQKSVFTQDLHGESKRRGLIFHKTQGKQSGSISVPPGKHDIVVRVQSPTDGYDLTKTVSGGFSSGAQSTLYIKCDKRKNKLDVAVQ